MTVRNVIGRVCAAAGGGCVNVWRERSGMDGIGSLGRFALAGMLAAFVLVGGPLAVSARAESQCSLTPLAKCFGFEAFEVPLSEEDGSTPTQAGSHPYKATFTLAFNHSGEYSRSKLFGNVKTAEVDLPRGLVVDPTATSERCTVAELYAVPPACPAASQVGEAVGEVVGVGFNGDVYNMVPPPGAPALLAFNILGIGKVVTLVGGVRSGSDYNLFARVPAVTQSNELLNLTVTLFGRPSGAVKPFLTLPSDCSGAPLVFSAQADSWQEREVFKTASFAGPVMTGCERLGFDPSLSVAPETKAADSPTGLHVDLHLPQDEELGGLATANMKSVRVSLPAGVTLDPSAADGLVGCSPSQVGLLTAPGVTPARFEPEVLSVKTGGRLPTLCPEASKLGSAEIVTPLLEKTLSGSMYLASPHDNPFGSLLALYFVVEDPERGVVVKIPGRVEADPVTGQLTTVFAENPELPVEDIKVHFFGGSRAPFTTPAVCGEYRASTDFTPWSTPAGADATPLSEPAFVVGEAPGGGGCVKGAGEEPNAPVFEAGTGSPVAGAFSPLVLHLQREDGSQRFQALNLTLPPGLLGKLAGVERCSPAEIEAAEHRGGEGEGALEVAGASCPKGSEIGVVHAGVGSGAPFFVTGHVYLADPWDGAPFSVVVVVPAVAGPFDLGTVVIRAGLFIDPLTAQVSVRSAPLPQILDGIPLDTRVIDLDIDRPEFIVNPTSCAVSAVSGSEVSSLGEGAGLSDRFQVGGCEGLPFKPSLTASTNGQTSKVDGASLDVRVVTRPGDANVQRVDVQLPGQLPARLPTLRQACTEAQFDANPAGCPAASDVASAVVHTPVLSSPLTGPVYFVSHGGQEFPELVIVLQGEGVRVDVVGETRIEKDTTYSRFEAVPDAPFSSFELSSPQGPNSIFGTALPAGADYDLCHGGPRRTVTVRRKVSVRVHGHRRTEVRKVKKTLAGDTPPVLSMPTRLVGQNGAVEEQDTKIEVTGCPAVKHASKSAPKHAKKHDRKRK